MSLEEENIEENREVAYFFADETWLEIEDKKHIILGAITPQDPSRAALAMVQVKNTLGFAPLEEVKMNTRGLTRDLKIKLTDGVIDILAGCTALISIVEGEDKQKAAELLALQVFDYCNQKDIRAFVLNLDKDLVPHDRQFEKYIRTHLNGGASCIGIQHLNSSSAQLIQCCDVFLGLYRLSMEVEFGGRIITRSVYRAASDFEEEKWSLSDYVVLSTRGQLWGESKVREIEGQQDREINHPFHYSMNLGFRIESTISQGTKQILEDKLATVYMGCLE